MNNRFYPVADNTSTIQTQRTWTVLFEKGKLLFLLLALMISQNVLAQNPFITTWKTDNAGTSNTTSVTLPTTGTGYLFDVDWDNDGIFDETGLTGNVTHDYGTAGTYTVAIKGAFPRIYFNNGGDKSKLLSIEQWGDVVWTSMEKAFRGCNKLVLNATDAPNTAAVTNMSYMFSNCSAFNQALPINFNTAAVTDMSYMFYACDKYNKALPSSFNTSAVKNMDSMFSSCSNYNQPFPSSFNTSLVENMSSMFSFSFSYNSTFPSSFSTASVKNMSSMFSYASRFNQNIGNWDLTKVTNMAGIFSSTGISKANYDAILTAWYAAGYTNKNLGNVSPLQYCAAQAERTALTTSIASGGRGWIIAGDASGCRSILTVKGNNVAIAIGDATPSTSDHTDFGEVNVSTASFVRTFTIQNTGDVALNLSGIPKVTIGGTNAADFTVNVQPNSPVAAVNGSTTFQITFSPSVGGLRTAIVNIPNNDPFNGNYHFYIQGTGLCTNTNTWIGGTSTNWSTASNWSCGIPNTSTNVVIPATTNTPTLSADMTVASLTFSGNSHLQLGNFNLTVNTLTGGSSTAYIVTNGTGSLTINNTGTSATLFPVGPSTSVYSPATITNNANRNFSVKVGTAITSPISGYKYVNLQWDITPSVSAGNVATLVLGWSSGSQAVGFNPASAVQVNHYNTTTSSWDISTSATVSGMNPYAATAFGMSSFSPFSISNVFVLPIELLDFKGTPQYNGNFLTWKTANEVNNKGFQIERALPQPQRGALPTWEVLGFADAKGKAATYEFTDKAPFGSWGLYRLRQIDNDGKETFSKVISIQNTSFGDSGLKVYPSVTTGILTIETPETTDFQVFNLLGQQVQTGQTTQQINVSTLSQGTYFLKIGSAKAKFIKTL